MLREERRSRKSTGSFQSIGDVPVNLTEADARIATTLRVKEPQEPQPTEHIPAGAGPGPNFYTSAQQTWFKENFCTPTGSPPSINNTQTLSLVNCYQGYSWVNSGWVQGAQYASQSWVGSEGTVNATLDVYNWVNGAQQLSVSYSVTPGTYRWLIYAKTIGAWPWHRSYMSGAGTNTTVSQATDDCGEANEWSCWSDCCQGSECDPTNVPVSECIGANNQCFCE
jgi:hypothetical protein